MSHLTVYAVNRQIVAPGSRSCITCRRDLTNTIGPSVILTDVTLVLPPPEAAQLAAAAAAAVQGTLPCTASFGVSYTDGVFGWRRVCRTGSACAMNYLYM
jgi:hypothetical protein